MPEAELDRVLAPVFSGVLEPSELRVPHANGALDETADPVAIGFEYTVELRGCPETKPLYQKTLSHMRGRAKNGLTG